MSEEEILNSIKDNLICLSKEKPKEFYGSITLYADDYDKDSLRSLIYDWQKLKGCKFSESFPITWGIVLTVRALWDSVERDRLLYEDLIDHSKLAIKEITDYLARL